MKKGLFTILILLISACAATSGENFPDFQTSSEAISTARDDFSSSENNFLGLLMVDRNGKVVRVRRLASKLDDFQFDRQVVEAMYDVVFHAAEQYEEDYREFIFPFAAGVSNLGSSVIQAFEPRDMGGANDRDPNNPR